MTDQRTGTDRRAKRRGGRRSTDTEIRDAYRQLDEAARLTKAARLVLAKAHDRVCDAMTPQDIANLTGIRYHTIIRDITLGALVSVKVQRGEQVRHYVRPDDAVRWLTQIGLPHLVSSITSQNPPATSST